MKERMILCQKNNIETNIISPIASITASLILSGSSFGLLHLFTYNYNWIQCLTIIGIPDNIKEAVIEAMGLIMKERMIL
ncbi:hypothetical protein ACT453_52375, partial [Bacillus sp. D-CC]